ncbi:MAG TPA: M23 family metallopeptidase [Spirochaetales bacterium]|nr:M23 family metallopeptidase [Spirochaetales bacterium]HRY54224.1 M23 family metallopeptidase [Spirochaetia bacterium]HRZ66019.1 M23 family metallopeptidase [Spirochaetia bacterium]
MESIIAGQKIAPRRPTSSSRRARNPGLGGLLRGLGPHPKPAPRADFLFLEGGLGAAGRRAAPRPEPRPRILAKGGSAPRQAGAGHLPPSSSTSLEAFFKSPPPPRRRWPGTGLRGLAGRLLASSAALGSGLSRRARALRLALSSLERKKALGLGAALLALVLTASTLGALLLRGPRFPLPQGELLPDDGAAADLLLSYALPDAPGAEEEESFAKIPAPPATLEIQGYTVRSGDSLASIAKRFRLSIDSIVSLNGIKSAKGIKAGASLRIPNMDGLVYRVRPGDNLAAIAKAYRTDMTKLADANDLGSSVLIPGQSIFIPGAKLPPQELRRVLGELVAWPLRGAISSYFGYRPSPFTGVRQFHAGIDIVASTGVSIRAAMDGKVADAGYNAIFGNYVILSHEGGLQTLYGHMSAISVKVGQKAGQGAVIGRVGSTGYSTGPHLHFGLFKGGAAVNPLKYLK